jgi:hypothetical protein
MGKLSISLLAAGRKAEFNSSEWKVLSETDSKGKTVLDEKGNPVPKTCTLKEFWDELHPGQYAQIEGNVGEVIVREFSSGPSYRIEIPFKDGSATEIRLATRDLEGKPVDLMEGDEVKIDSITCFWLKKMGEDPILRVLAEKIDE